MVPYEEAAEAFRETLMEENPAIVPELPEPQPKTYRVVGTQPVFDHAPGETFTETIPFDREEMYLTYGHLAVVPEGSEKEASAPVEGESSESTSEEKGQ